MLRHCILLLLMLGIVSLLPAHPPWGIQVDSKGNIYFPDIMHNGRGTLWKFTPDGKLIPLLKDFHAHNVNLDRNENPVSAHGEDNHTMVRIYPDGKLDTLFHTHDLNEFFGGNAAYSPDIGILFSLRHKLWVIDDQGIKRPYSDQSLEWSQAILPAPDGSVYRPEIGFGKGKVYRMGPDGSKFLVADDLISKLDRPYDKHNDVLLGMALDEDGALYVCELAGKRVIRIQPGGDPESWYIPEGGWAPTGLTFRDGKAYVLEHLSQNGLKGPRVVQINEMGTARVLVNYETYDFSSASPQVEEESKRGEISESNFGYILWGAGLIVVLLAIFVILGIRKNKSNQFTH